MDMTIPQRRTLTIRCLATWEVQSCVPFGQAFHTELHVPGQFIPEVFIRNWRRLLDSGNGDILSLWNGEEAMGGLGTVIGPDLLDDRLVATEIFWFIGEQYRRGTGAFRLIDAFHEWAKEKGAVETRMTHLLAPDEDWRDCAFSRMYQKRGYRQIEVNWLRSVNEEV